MNTASNMIAKWYQNATQAPPQRVREDARHADGERRAAAGAVVQRLLLHLRGQRLHLVRA